jgi:hypothetical protein
VKQGRAGRRENAGRARTAWPKRQPSVYGLTGIGAFVPATECEWPCISALFLVHDVRFLRLAFRLFRLRTCGQKLFGIVA